MKLNPFNTKIGLALGGGAAKGIAHIGVLKAFEEAEIPIHCVSGTSIGALVAAYHAFGKSADEIMVIGRQLSFRKVANFTLSRKGMFTTEAIEELILRDLGDVNIEDARKPLAIVAADIVTGEKVVFRKGNLARAISATVAVPGAYVPVEHMGRLLVDGGIVENVPISPLESMGAGILVGVDLNGVKRYPLPKDTFGVIGNAFDIAIDLRTRDQLKQCDVVISLDLSKYSRLGNADEFDELFQEGYGPAQEKINTVIRRKSVNLFFYALKAIKEFVPVKMPLFFRKRLMERKDQIEYK